MAEVFRITLVEAVSERLTRATLGSESVARIEVFLKKSNQS
ncbi:MAG: hypothetical protein AAGC81_18945 [Pseudomonadota bacterium]